MVVFLSWYFRDLPWTCVKPNSVVLCIEPRDLHQKSQYEHRLLELLIKSLKRAAVQILTLIHFPDCVWTVVYTVYVSMNILLNSSEDVNFFLNGSDKFIQIFHLSFKQNIFL